MKERELLSVILLLGIFGVLFSGYLTYYTFRYHSSACELYFFGKPSCFYGLIMYALVLVLSALVLRLSRNRIGAALVAVSIIGIIFSGSITWYLLTNPSCSSLSIYGIPPASSGW